MISNGSSSSNALHASPIRKNVIFPWSYQWVPNPALLANMQQTHREHEEQFISKWFSDTWHVGDVIDGYGQLPCNANGHIFRSSGPQQDRHVTARSPESTITAGIAVTGHGSTQRLCLWNVDACDVYWLTTIIGTTWRGNKYEPTEMSLRRSYQSNGQLRLEPWTKPPIFGPPAVEMNCRRAGSLYSGFDDWHNGIQYIHAYPVTLGQCLSKVLHVLINVLTRIVFHSRTHTSEWHDSSNYCSQGLTNQNKQHNRHGCIFMYCSCSKWAVCYQINQQIGH